MSTRLIIALDFSSQKQALTLVEQLDPKYCALKVGHELFTAHGPAFVRTLVSRGFNIFLDLKYHDIPNTVKRACQAAAELGVWLLNVHALGGLEMMQQAKLALEPFGNARPLLIAVTLLTSTKANTLINVGLHGSMDAHVIQLAQLAKRSGLDGVVCSALETPQVKSVCGDGFLTVTPGIRLPNYQEDDQARIVTPEQALAAGSDYLVVGRPITQAKQPKKIVDIILKSIKN